MTGVERRLTTTDLLPGNLDLEAGVAEQGLRITDRAREYEISEAGHEQLHPRHERSIARSPWSSRRVRRVEPLTGSCLCGGVRFELTGSSLFGGTWPEGTEVSVRFGSLDGAPGIRPQYHSHVDSAAPWDELPEDGLPRRGGASPAG
jgi:hypothetical protein